MARKQTSPIIAHASAFVLFTSVCACAPDSDQPIEDLRTAPNRLGPDFNGDGYADLVIGVPDDAIGEPLEELDGLPVGSVNVLYGSAHGLTEDGDQFWHQDRAGIDGEAGEGDLFGRALAIGDFDDDGYTDLAIGVPFENNLAGAVHVLYGSPAGLSADDSQLWDQDQPGIEGEADDEEQFGTALTSGDFDNDGYDDLAIGAPFDEEIGGAVNVIYGSANGLSAAGNQRWTQDVEGNQRFGQALAAGDFDGDGHDDLAIGAPGQDLGDIERAGQVDVLYGSDRGLTTEGEQEWNQDTPGIEGLAEAFDRFGSTLTIGDFDDDGYGDLVVGVPLEDVGDDEDAGAVHVIYGSRSGLHENDDQYWHQNTPGVDGLVEPGDSFGSALAAGDFDGDGEDDLAIGVLGEDIGGIEDAGWIHVLHGTSSGLDENDDQVWHQDTPGVDGLAEVGDAFGSALTASDFDGDGKADLAIGVPLEDVGDIVNAGAINVLYGKRSGLDDDDDQVWHQDISGVEGTAAQNDQFGAALR